MRHWIVAFIMLLVAPSAMAQAWNPDVPGNTQTYVMPITGTGTWDDAAGGDFLLGSFGANSCLRISPVANYLSGSGSPESCAFEVNGLEALAFPFPVFITKLSFTAGAMLGTDDGCSFILTHDAAEIGSPVQVPPVDNYTGVVGAFSPGESFTVPVNVSIPAGGNLRIAGQIGPNSFDGTAPVCAGAFGRHWLTIEYIRGATP